MGRPSRRSDRDEIVAFVKAAAPTLGGIKPGGHRRAALLPRSSGGVFRGALDVRASRINEEMKPAAARAIASVVADDELDPGYIIPSVFNREVASA